MKRVAIFDKIKTTHQKIKDTQVVQAINGFLLSPLGIGIMALLTLLSYAFALELWLYTLVLIVGTYIFIFSDDLSALMPLFIFCYVAPAKENNPGLSETSIFYIGSGGGYVLSLAGVAIVGFILRMLLDKMHGFKAMLKKKRYLLSGMLILSGAYILSGIGSERYFEFFKNNLIFALLQCVCLIALY